MSTPAPRRLAAIVATDVVGFSSLVGRDEDGTLSALRDLQSRLIGPLTTSKGGRRFKTMGDGALYEFPSVVQAVEAAVAFQDAMADESGPFTFRIGIHLGDVIPDGDDLLGDGVNVAKRIEAAAPVGGVALSDDAYRQVRDRLPVNWVDGGERSLKNIVHKMRVWHWSPAEAPLSKSSTLTVAEVVKPSIAVLPFDNFSDDPEQTYFSDGLVEDVTTALSRYSGLRVVSRSSAFSFRGQSVDLRTIAQALGVRYVLEGSVRRGGSRLRVTAQLIEAEPDLHVWADRYNREVTDLFDIQDEITEAIVGAVASEIDTVEFRRVRHRDIQDLDAWERYKKAYWLGTEPNLARNFESQRILQEEIAAGRETSDVWALLSQDISHDLLWGLTGQSPAELIPRAIEAAQTAVKLNPANERAHASLSQALGMAGHHDDAIAAGRTAIRLNPNFVLAHNLLAAALILSGQEHHKEAEALLDRAMLLGPRDFYLRWTYSHRSLAALLSGDYQRSIEMAQRALEHDPRLPNPLAYMTAALAFEGRLDEARAAWQRRLALLPFDPVQSQATMERVLKCREDAEKFAQGLMLAGVPITVTTAEHAGPDR